RERTTRRRSQPPDTTIPISPRGAPQYSCAHAPSTLTVRHNPHAFLLRIIPLPFWSRTCNRRTATRARTATIPAPRLPPPVSGQQRPAGCKYPVPLTYQGTTCNQVGHG